MAPLHSLISSVKRSENIRRTAGSTEPPLDLGATVGIAIGIACVTSFALATFVYYFYHRQQRIMAMRARQGNRAGAMGNGPYGTQTSTPMRGLGYVLSMFSSKRRGPRGGQQIPSSHYMSSGDLRPTSDKEWDALHEPAVELDGGLVRKNTAYSRAQANYSQASFEDVHRQVNGINSIPSYTPASNAERHIDSEGAIGHTSADINKMAITMPSTTDAAAAPAAWHRKRTGPPPPLTIEPPGMYSQSPLDAYSAYSTYATAQSPYEYCSINVPTLPPLPSHTSMGFGTRFPYDGEEPLRSSDSTRSSHPLQLPPSPQTPGSIPSIGRSDSGVQESQPLAPPTPTYSLPRSQPSPQRTTIIEATHFECLGPLPDHIEIPSPPYFRTAHQQQPEDPFLTPRVLTPEDHRSPVVGGGQESSTITTSATGETIQVFVQDPLLHESNPFRHLPSPVHPTFDRELSVHAQSIRDGGSCSPADNRRDSTDSLGSNFTVEEEARIQEQIVRNLEALDKERVMGEMDIVHIPQVSARRYSWEE